MWLRVQGTLSRQHRSKGHHERRHAMDKDRIKGSAQQAKGKIKEVAGKATGDKKLEGEGKADKIGGKNHHALRGQKEGPPGGWCPARSGGKSSAPIWGGGSFF